jgi:hypothetical protein
MKRRMDRQSALKTIRKAAVVEVRFPYINQNSWR